MALLVAMVATVGLIGCAAGTKKDTPKELTRLSEDSREEADKLRRDGNQSAAMAKYQEALRYHPGPAIHKDLGDLLVEMNRYEEGRAQYKLAKMKDPNLAGIDESISQLDARMQLAKSRDEVTGRPVADTLPPDSFATGGPAMAGASRGGETYDEEDRLFESMEQIEPPLQARTVQADPDSFDRTDSSEADALMRDSQGLFGIDTPAAPLDEFETASPSVVRSPGSSGVGTLASGPQPQTHLAGGRGLLGPGRKPSVLLASSKSSDFSPDLESRPRQVSSGRNPETVAPTRDALLPSGRPGERGLASHRRVPEVVDTLPSVPTSERPTPSFSTGEPAPVAVSKLDEASPENRGFFANLIDRGDSKIDFPDPSATSSKVEQGLPSPYPERERIDLTKMDGGRLKGRRDPVLDLETCKRRYYEERDLEGAVRCFGDKRIDFPDEPLLYYELAKIYEDAGSPERAREHYALALRYDPDNTTYKQALAVSDIKSAEKLREAGDLRGARDLLLQTVKKYPEMIAAHRELAKVYIQDAQRLESRVGEGGTPEQMAEISASYANAETVYADVVELAPDNFKDWYNLGVAIQNQYDDAKSSSAIRAYERAVELDSNYAPAHRNLAILYESRSVPKAIEHHTRALAIARTESDAESLAIVTDSLRDLGSLHWRIGETEKAAEYLTEYMQYVPSDAEVEQILDQITSVPPQTSAG